MIANFKPKGLIAAVLALLIIYLSAVLYESGIISDEFYLKLISAVNTEITSAELEVHFIDVGQAECILIKAPEKTLLIDSGDIGFGKTVENYLRKSNVHYIDVFIATHPHSDHIGCASDIVKKFPIGEVIISEIPKEHLPTTSLFEDFLKTLKSRNRKVSYAKVGRVFELGGGCVLEILSPEGDKGDNLNNYSVVSKLTYGETSFLFTGDAEEIIEQELLASGKDISATVFNAAHHGSSTSNSEDFLKAVGAKYAVISCGRNNDYGHPHKEVTSRFKKLGIKYYRTDYDGDIVLGSDGKSITVKTEKAG